VVYSVALRFGWRFILAAHVSCQASLAVSPRKNHKYRENTLINLGGKKFLGRSLATWQAHKGRCENPKDCNRPTVTARPKNALFTRNFSIFAKSLFLLSKLSKSSKIIV